MANQVTITVNINNLEDSIKKMEELSSRITAINGKTTNLHVRVTGAEQANSQLSRIADTISNITNLASGMSSAISGFASGITNAFSGMSSMFNTDFMNVAYRTVAHQITNSFMSAIPAVIQRYDIMSTFTDYMNLAGVDTETANAALSRVDQSIRGIPIGLDEAAFRLRRYQMYLGDIDRATNLTIGVQNALMAGGASEQMRNTAYTQIDRLLATGKLSQARQWMSLFNGLGVSLRFLKEELALDPTASMQQVASDLASGAIATDDFLHAMERLADNEGLTQALTIYKGTIEAWMANIKNAIKRGGQAIMEAMDDVMTDQFGEGITGVLKIVRDQIDAVAEAGANFIRQNPELVGTLGEIFGGIWERIQSADFSGFIEKFVDRLGTLADIIFRIFDNLPDGFLSDFVTFATTIAGPLSMIFKAVNSGLPLLLGVFERFDKPELLADIVEKIVHQVENFANVIAKLLNLIPDGLLGDLMAFGLVWGKPLANVISSIGGAISGIIKGLSGSGGRGFMNVLGSIIMNPGSFLAPLGFMGAVGVGSALASMVERERRAMEEVSAQFIDDVFGDTSNITNAADSATQSTKDLIFNSERALAEIDANRLEALNAADAINAYNNELGKTDNIERRKTLTDGLNESMERFQTLTGISWSEENETLARNYINLQSAQDTYQTLRDQQTALYEQNVQNRLDRDALNILIQRRQGQLDKLDAQIAGILPGGFEAIGEQFEANGYTSPLASAFALLSGRAPISGAHEYTDSSGLLRYSAFGLSKEQTDALAQLGIEYNDLLQLQEEDEARQEALNEQIEIATQLYKDYGERAGEVAYEMERLKAIDYSPLGMEVEFETLDTALQKTIASFNTFRDAAKESIHEALSGFNEFEPPRLTDEYDENGNLTAEREVLTIGEITANLDARKSYVESLKDDYSEILKFMYENRGTDIVTQLSGAVEELANLDPVEAGKYVNAITESLSDPTALQAFLDAFNGRELGENMLAEIMGSLQEAATDPDFWANFEGNENWFGETGVLSQILGLDNGEAEKDIATEVFAPVVEALDDVGEEAGDAKVAVGNLAETFIARMGVVSRFGRVMSTLAGEVGAAEGAVLGLRWAINSLPSNKKVTVTYSGVRDTSVSGRDQWSQPIITAATGGYIYGNGVPYLAIGSDSVPALLTPGEYVVNRNAVNMFGQTFLEAVNGMDVGAAYDAMMSRVSVPHGSTYNYYDNHATVNQNFYGNTGQGFSQKKAFKFVSAL